MRKRGARSTHAWGRRSARAWRSTPRQARRAPPAQARPLRAPSRASAPKSATHVGHCRIGAGGARLGCRAPRSTESAASPPPACPPRAGWEAPGRARGARTRPLRGNGCVADAAAERIAARGATAHSCAACAGRMAREEELLSWRRRGCGPPAPLSALLARIAARRRREWWGCVLRARLRALSSALHPQLQAASIRVVR